MVGFYTKLHKLTKVGDQNLYSKAEDVANKIRVLKGRGEDVRRHFMKNGVKKEELAELGLTELFKRDKVTKQQILDVIEDNRVEFVETIGRGGSTDSFEFDSETEYLDIEESYGPEHIKNEVDYFRSEAGGSYEWNDIYENVYRMFSDQDDVADAELAWNRFVDGDAGFDDLPQDIQEFIDGRSEEIIRSTYAEDPVQRITLTVVDENGDPTNVGDKANDGFSYSLIGNDDTGWHLDGNEALIFNDSFRNQFNEIYSENEAEIRLQSIARTEAEEGNMDLGSLGSPEDTSWGQYTLDGGDNYQEIRLSLPGDQRFKESIHFPDDINNIFHIRTKDREGPNGEKILYVEELQSDWAQQGRKKGFGDPKRIEVANEAAKKMYADLEDILKVTGSLDGTAMPRSIFELSENIDLKRPDISGGNTLRVANRVHESEIIDNAQALRKEAILDVFTPDELREIAEHRVRQANRSASQGQRLGAEMPELDEEQIRQLAQSEINTNDELNIYSVRKLKEKLGMPELGALSEYFGNVARTEMSNYLEGMGLPRDTFERIDATLQQNNPQVTDVPDYMLGRDVMQLADEHQMAGASGMLPKKGPFVLDTDSWNKLAVKRIFQMAEEGGYDGVSFTPADVHIDRWGDEGLRSQYEKSIPSAIKKVIGKTSPNPNRVDKFGNPISGSQMEVDGYDSKIYFLDDINADGETASERVSGPMPMFSPAPITLAAGITGLGMAQKARADTLAAQGATHEMVLDALSGAGSVIGGGLSGLAEYTRNIPKRILMDDEESEALAARQEAVGDYVSEGLNYEPRSEMGRSMSKSAQEGIAGLLQPAIEYAKPEVKQFMDYIQSEEQRNSPLGALYRGGKYVYEDIFGEPERQATKDALDLI
mgnify:CR=1 FL=1